MKKILSAFVLMVLVWGCAKKITPENSGTATTSANTQARPSEPNARGEAETVMATVTPAENGAPKPEMPNDAAIAAGQNIFNAKCGRCHALKNPGDFTAVRWTGILDAMAPKANLTDAEKENVYAYVKTNAKK